MRVSAKLGPCVWPRQRPAATLLPSLCRSFVCLLRSGDDGRRLDELTARLQELVRLAATRNDTPARQRGDHANRGLFYRPEGRRHERPSVPLAELQQAVRRAATVDTEARATTTGITSHLILCRWLLGRRRPT